MNREVSLIVGVGKEEFKMSREKLEIRKGGRLVETKWKYDETIKKGEYVERDITKNAIRYLFEPCELEQGVSLRDVFLLLNTELDIFDSIIGNWCKEIVTEGLTQPSKPYQFDEEGIEYLELYWSFYYDDGSEYGPSFYGYNRPSFHGIGFERKENKYFDWTSKDGSKDIEHAKGSRTNWGISFSKANDLIDIPVKLDDKVTVFDDNLDHEGDHKAKTGWHYSLTEYKGATYTLGNILEGIVWEMSFHGGPGNRDKVSQELRDTVDDIKSGKAETVSADEFFNELDIDEDTNN